MLSCNIIHLSCLFGTFISFKQLIKNNTLFIPPNVEDICFWGWCRLFSQIFLGFGQSWWIHSAFKIIFSCWNINSQMKRVLSKFLSFSSHGSQCPCFWIIHNASEHLLSMFPCSNSIWHWSWWSKVSNCSSSYFVGARASSFSHPLKPKLLILKLLLPSSQVVFDRSLSPYLSTRIPCALTADLFWIEQE